VLVEIKGPIDVGENVILRFYSEMKEDRELPFIFRKPIP
jgi:hypothetical protein